MDTPVYKSRTVFQRVLDNYLLLQGRDTIKVDEDVPLALLSSMYPEYNVAAHMTCLGKAWQGTLRTVEHELELVAPAKRRSFYTMAKSGNKGKKSAADTWFHKNEYDTLAMVLDAQRSMTSIARVRPPEGNYSQYAAVEDELLEMLSRKYSYSHMITIVYAHTDSIRDGCWVEEADASRWEDRVSTFFEYSEARAARRNAAASRIAAAFQGNAII